MMPLTNTRWVLNMERNQGHLNENFTVPVPELFTIYQGDK